MKYSESQQIKSLISDAKIIVILQADNPDGDSLASSLALEHILGDMGKEIFLYCGVDMPGYLHYLPGWDRVSKEIPGQFDLSIIVDTSAISLFELLEKSGQKSWVVTRPCIVIDHHDVEATIPFATVVLNQPAVSTGEIIFELAKQLDWPLNKIAKDMLAISIMSDSLGLMTDSTTARSIHVIAELVEAGVKLAQLEDARRLMMRKSPDLIHYKGRLLERVEYFSDDRVAIITIPWGEIQLYSQAYNPTMLVLDDMRLTENTDIVIGFKLYYDGKVTAKIRCNYGKAVANELAQHFGGGGHAYASGFKITDGRAFSDIKAECIDVATELLDKQSNELEQQ